MLKVLKENQVYFVEGIINEDVIFGFETFLKAQKICFFNANVLYRVREGSISNPKTFSQHSNALLWRSYQTNARYLADLLQKPKLKCLFPLLQRCLISCAQMPVLCWIKDPTLCKKNELEFLKPFMNRKTYLAYQYPILARIILKFRDKLRELKG